MFKTLYAKISTVFILLLLVFGTVLLYLSFNSSRSYVCEATQKLNYRLATQFAHRCEPLFQDSIHFQQLRRDVMEFTELNPNADVFMLDSNGRIMASSSPRDKLVLKRVNLAPVKYFLEPNSFNHIPIFGDDPLVENGRKIFSAAKIDFGDGQSGYLYVTLASARTDLGGDNIVTSYILRSGSLAILTTLFFAGIIGLLLFFILTKRVHLITRAVIEFAGGNYTQRIEQPENQDEVAQLAKAFNSMAETIERNVHELEQNDRARRMLIENISHDLRSPLTSIQGYLETIQIKRKELEPHQEAEFLEISLKNVIQLNQLVNQLFELSKLDAQQSKPHKEPFSFSELVQDVSLKFRPQAEEKQVVLKQQCAAQIPLVWGDVAMIDRVVSNLVDNAIKYSNPGGRVELNLEAGAQGVRFEIRDFGIGISEEDLPQIFNRFYMADKSRNRKQHGSGLGLAIAKKIIEAHESTLYVESKAGQGTAFWFYLAPVVQ